MSAVLSLATPTHPKREDLAIRTLLITHHPTISKGLFSYLIASVAASRHNHYIFLLYCSLNEPWWLEKDYLQVEP